MCVSTAAVGTVDVREYSSNEHDQSGMQRTGLDVELCPLQVVEDAPDASDPEFFIKKQIRHEAAWKQVAKQVAEDRQLAAVLQQEEQGPKPSSTPQSHTPNQVSATTVVNIYIGLDHCCGVA